MGMFVIIMMITIMMMMMMRRMMMMISHYCASVYGAVVVRHVALVSVWVLLSSVTQVRHARNAMPE